MDRRTFLRSAAGVGGVAVIGGGLWGRRELASHELKRKLIADVSPVLTYKAHSEFLVIPVKGREEIRQWFHGKCLNVAPFVNEVCSNGYREKLHACRSVEDQQRLLMVTFFGKVATDAEIINRVQTILGEADQELDMNWGDCCKKIASQWNVHITKYSNALETTELLGRVDQLVKSHLDESLEMARMGAQYPSFGETSGKIGRSALMILPMTQITVNLVRGQLNINPLAQVLALPTFVFLALEHVCQYIAGLFSDPRADLQRSISSRIALLGNRVGDEFASGLRTRLELVHGWQERSLTGAAEHYAESAVGWL